MEVLGERLECGSSSSPASSGGGFGRVHGRGRLRRGEERPGAAGRTAHALQLRDGGLLSVDDGDARGGGGRDRDCRGGSGGVAAVARAVADGVGL